MCDPKKCQVYCKNSRFTSIRSVVSFFSLAFGLTGGILLLVATVKLDSLPAKLICQQQGFAAVDCESPEQTIFFTNATISGVLATAPPCCLGARDAIESWTTPFSTNLALSFNSVSCKDIARSARAGIVKCGRVPPCPELAGSPGTLLGGDIPDDVLESVESMTYDSCLASRLQGGYLFLFMTGPSVLVSTLLMAAAHWRSFKPLASIGVFVGAVTVALVVVGVDTMLRLRLGMGWQNTIACAGLDQSYVQNGSFFGLFTCHDQRRDGGLGNDPDFSYVSTATVLFSTGAALSVFGIVTYVVLLITKRPKGRQHQHQQQQVAAHRKGGGVRSARRINGGGGASSSSSSSSSSAAAAAGPSSRAVLSFSSSSSARRHPIATATFPSDQMGSDMEGSGGEGGGGGGGGGVITVQLEPRFSTIMMGLGDEEEGRGGSSSRGGVAASNPLQQPLLG